MPGVNLLDAWSTKDIIGFKWNDRPIDEINFLLIFNLAWWKTLILLE